MRAITLGATRIELEFDAPGTNGDHPSPARSYLIKQSTRPIRTAHDFAAAPALCDRGCRFNVTEVGARLALTITRLEPRTTYYYASAARDNITGTTGPRTPTTKTHTG